MAKNNVKYKAVTLLELLTVIAIIGIMTAAGLVSLNSGKTMAKLQAAQREVASAIKLTQSYALQGKVTPEGTTPCGYGFRFDPSDTINKAKYEIFYNTWGPTGWGAYTSCEEMNKYADARHWKNGFSHSPALVSSQLNNGVILSLPDIYAGGSPPNTTEIYFTIPGGGIYGNDGNAYTGPQTLTFSLQGNIKTITIDSGGSVTEQ